MVSLWSTVVFSLLSRQVGLKNAVPLKPSKAASSFLPSTEAQDFTHPLGEGWAAWSPAVRSYSEARAPQLVAWG